MHCCSQPSSPVCKHQSSLLYLKCTLLHCQGMCNTLVLSCDTSSSILKTVEELEEAGTSCFTCALQCKWYSMLCICGICPTCSCWDPPGQMSGKGTPLSLSLPSLLFKLLQGISLHKGLIWARARDARLRALPCCLVSYNTKPRH